MQSKEDTVALWLHNKLGSASHLWSFSSTVVSQYTVEKLQSIRDCFTTLDSLVKFKFFLSLFHTPKRNFEEFKPIVQDIIENTTHMCLDQWVLSIATFVQSYWLTQSLDTTCVYELESFTEAYNDLAKALRNCVESEAGCERAKFLLPIECDYMNKSARLSILPQNRCLFNEVLTQLMSAPGSSGDHHSGMLMDDMPILGGAETSTLSATPSKTHFTVLKHPKSLSNIDDLRSKSGHYSKNKSAKSLLMSTSGSSIGNENEMINASSKSFPFVNRFSSKKIESIAALNNSNFNNNDSYSSKIFSNSSNSSLNKSGGSSSFFKHSMMSSMSSSTTITGKSSTIKRDIGIKLLDASEQSATPKEAKRKRKEQEKEALKKLKQEQKQVEKEQTIRKSVDDTGSNDTDTSRNEDTPPITTNMYMDVSSNVAATSERQQTPVKEENNSSQIMAAGKFANGSGSSAYPNHPSLNTSGGASTLYEPQSSNNGSHTPTSHHHHHHHHQIITPQISSLNDLYSASNNNNNNNNNNQSLTIQSQQQQQQSSSLSLPTFSLSATPSSSSSSADQQMTPGQYSSNHMVSNYSSNVNTYQPPGMPVINPHMDYMQSQSGQQHSFYSNYNNANNGMSSYNNQPQHIHQQQQQQQQQSPLQLPTMTQNALSPLKTDHRMSSQVQHHQQQHQSPQQQQQQQPPPQQQQQQQHNQHQPQQHQPSQNQPSLSLTREQMLQAQEMFSNSNKLTRPEKALILGFIAGSRENPRPEQGSIVSIKLNEVEEVLTASSGQQHRVISELYFQMNYDTGEYKKVKKLKPITTDVY